MMGLLQITNNDMCTTHAFAILVPLFFLLLLSLLINVDGDDSRALSLLFLLVAAAPGIRQNVKLLPPRSNTDRKPK